jgi:nucleotide-binding universal stress UspA family protein
MFVRPPLKFPLDSRSLVMSFKDIAVFLFSTNEDEAALAAGEALARETDADLAAVLLELQPDPVYTMEGVMVSAMWAEVLAEARKGFAKEKAALEARVRKSERNIAVRELLVASGFAAMDAAVQARHADLSIMLRPGGTAPSDYRKAIFEGVLFDSGRPVLLAPAEWRAPIGKNVVIAWNGKREAARAIADAESFLDRADKITIVTVDAHPSPDGVGPAPGADIAAHLARRGLKVDVVNLDGLGRDEAETLLAGAAEIGADLIVMGGYGRPRFSEWIFGGVTRTMIDTAPMPVLMSH